MFGMKVNKYLKAKQDNMFILTEYIHVHGMCVIYPLSHELEVVVKRKELIHLLWEIIPIPAMLIE